MVRVCQLFVIVLTVFIFGCATSRQLSVSEFEVLYERANVIHTMYWHQVSKIGDKVIIKESQLPISSSSEPREREYWIYFSELSPEMQTKIIGHDNSFENYTPKEIKSEDYNISPRKGSGAITVNTHSDKEFQGAGVIDLLNPELTE